MGLIPEHKIDEVRDSISIVDVIGRYVALKQAGRIFKGLCPFHPEKTPSFTVNPDKRIFHCFGCGVGGNVFRFLMMQKGMSFVEAVEELAEERGIDLPRTGLGSPSVPREGKNQLYEVTSLAQEFFQEQLAGPSGKTARHYLDRRGITRDIVREFGLGWAPAGWDHLYRHLEGRKISQGLMEKAGLVRPRPSGRGGYDTFRGRIICPIFDLDGKAVAFGGRLIDDEPNQPKYLNSPETPVYRKGRILYGFHLSRDEIRQRKAVFVVEGYFDLLSLAAHGVRHVVATLGTALTREHLRLLQGYVSQIHLVFDADEAGRTAAARALPLFLSADLEGRVLTLPEGHDPDTFVRDKGPEALEEAASSSRELLDFYLTRTLSKYPDSLAGKSKAAQEIMTALDQVDGPTRQDLIFKTVAAHLGISEEALKRSAQMGRRVGPIAVSGQAPQPVDRVTEDFEVGLVRLLLAHDDAGSVVFGTDLAARFKNDSAKAIFEAMEEVFAGRGLLDISMVMDRLDPNLADLTAALASADDGLDRDDLPRAVDDFLNKFFERERRDRMTELSRQIKNAQESGDHSGATMLLMEKNRLLRENTI